MAFVCDILTGLVGFNTSFILKVLSELADMILYFLK